jgi:hypothetical protein
MSRAGTNFRGRLACRLSRGSRVSCVTAEDEATAFPPDENGMRASSSSHTSW